MFGNNHGHTVKNKSAGHELHSRHECIPSSFHLPRPKYHILSKMSQRGS